MGALGTSVLLGVAVAWTAEGPETPPPEDPGTPASAEASLDTTLTPSPDFAEKARELARLRAGIEQMEGTLRREREAVRRELSALAVQEEELRLLVERERFRAGQLATALAVREESLADRRESVEALRGAIEAALTQVESAVATSLPFRLQDRLAAIHTLRDDVQREAMEFEAAVSRLWQIVEDEIRLGETSGLYQQTIEIGGSQELVEVVRLGMVALYYRADGGRYGHAVLSDDGFRFEPLPERSRWEPVRRLFEAMARQHREGRFDLPMGRPLEIAP